MDTYEKKYNEALERAREYLNPVYPIADATLVQQIFPELAESEDERIRKAIIYNLSNLNIIYNATKEECLSWLEKQKENPKSADSIPADCVSSAKCLDRDSKYGVFPEDVIVVARACEKLEAHGYSELAHALKNVNLYTKPTSQETLK